MSMDFKQSDITIWECINNLLDNTDPGEKPNLSGLQKLLEVECKDRPTYE